MSSCARKIVKKLREDEMRRSTKMFPNNVVTRYGQNESYEFKATEVIAKQCGTVFFFFLKNLFFELVALIFCPPTTVPDCEPLFPSLFLHSRCKRALWPSRCQVVDPRGHLTVLPWIRSVSGSCFRSRCPSWTAENVSWLNCRRRSTNLGSNLFACGHVFQRGLSDAAVTSRDMVSSCPSGRGAPCSPSDKPCGPKFTLSA